MITADAVSAALALAFFAAGVQKLTGARQQLATAERLHIPWGQFRLVAIPEIAASLGLIVGYSAAALGVAAAAGLALLMGGAVGARLRVRDSASFILGDLAFLSAAIVAAVLRARIG